MAKIDNLLARVTDPALRADLAEAAAEIRSRRSFGLVFESHLPESVRLPHHPVRRGTKVAYRAPSTGGTFNVLSVAEGVARMVPDGDEVDGGPRMSRRRWRSSWSSPTSGMRSIPVFAIWGPCIGAATSHRTS